MSRWVGVEVTTAYVARAALVSVGFLLRVLPRRNKVTMLTRQSATPSDDFLRLRDAILRADPTLEVVVIARMVPPGVLRKFGYVFHLLAQMYHAETSRVLIVDGYSLIASAVGRSHGLRVVQTWHALGSLKKFGLSILGQAGGRDPRLARAMRMHTRYDLVVASAERCRVPFAEALGVDVAKVVVAPLPRVDRLRDTGERARARAAFDANYPSLASERIALFAPTFRSGGEHAETDPVELTRALRRAGYALITKLHPLVAPPDHPEVHTAPGMSTQQLLLVADVFITDYSSAIFEAAVAGVPSYLLAPDLDEYAVSRDFYAKYPGELGIPFAVTVNEVVMQIAAGLSTKEDARRLREAWVEVPDGELAADRLARIVLGGSDENPPEVKRPPGLDQ